MNNRLIMLWFLGLGASVFVTSAQTQRRVTPAPVPAGRAGFVHMRRARRSFVGSAFVPFSDYNSEPDTIEVPSPEVIVWQSAQPASSAPAPNPAPSLVLELQGDHWVRITNYGQSQTVGPDSQQTPSTTSAATPRRTLATELPSVLPLAVLVFRDGHKEEIGRYLIIGATIHTSADYWSSGSWTRKVQIAELDVPATLKLNQERGTEV